MTSTPNKPWDTVSVDFGGPYPDGHYKLVVIDKRTKNPIVEPISSTKFSPVKERFKHIFATYSTPRIIESDNGPPFTSKEYDEFAKEEGLELHRITPIHPRANGESEKFMQTMNKTGQIASLEEKDKHGRQNAIHDMLVSCRSTPHPATGVTPCEAVRDAAVRTKLDHTRPTTEKRMEDEKIDLKDAEYKAKRKRKRENRNTKETILILGDHVLVTQPKKNKWITPYEPVFYTVIDKQGSKVTARRTTDGRIVCRDVSQFKLVNTVINTADETEVKIDRKNTHPIEITGTTKPENLESATALEQKTGEASPSGTGHTDAEGDSEGATGSAAAEIIQEAIEGQDIPEQRTRSRRERRKPKYLKDYVLK